MTARRARNRTCNIAWSAHSRSFLWWIMLSSNFSSMLNPRSGLTYSKTSCNVQRESSSSALQLSILPSLVRLSKGLETWKADKWQAAFEACIHRLENSKYRKRWSNEGTLLGSFCGPYERNSSKKRPVTRLSCTPPYTPCKCNQFQLKSVSYKSWMDQNNILILVLGWSCHGILSGNRLL